MEVGQRLVAVRFAVERGYGVLDEEWFDPLHEDRFSDVPRERIARGSKITVVDTAGLLEFVFRAQADIERRLRDVGVPGRDPPTSPPER